MEVSTILVDPVTRKPLPAIPGEHPRRCFTHWIIERAADGTPLRMRWAPCDDQKCQS
jgi:hypothetical protein